LEQSESSTRFKVIGLQLGVGYVSRAAHKEDSRLTLGRRHQLKVLVGDGNIKATERRKYADSSHLIAHKSDKKFTMYDYKYCYEISPVRVAGAT
jgi:hypothetical protein